MTARLAAAREAWAQVVDALRHEPFTDAHKLADEICRDLDELFGSYESSTDMLMWLKRSASRGRS